MRTFNGLIAVLGYLGATLCMVVGLMAGNAGEYAKGAYFIALSVGAYQAAWRSAAATEGSKAT